MGQRQAPRTPWYSSISISLRCLVIPERYVCRLRYIKYTNTKFMLFSGYTQSAIVGFVIALARKSGSGPSLASKLIQEVIHGRAGSMLWLSNCSSSSTPPEYDICLTAPAGRLARFSSYSELCSEPLGQTTKSQRTVCAKVICTAGTGKSCFG